MLLHLRYGIYDTVTGELYLRAPIKPLDDETPPPRQETPTVVDKDEGLFLFLCSELGQGSTGVVHGGFLEFDQGDRRSRLEVAAKLSFAPDQRQRLQEEWSILMYLTLNEARGIPALLGIFYEPDHSVAPLCILTCHGGISLRHSGRKITSEQR